MKLNLTETIDLILTLSLTVLVTICLLLKRPWGVVAVLASIVFAFVSSSPLNLVFVWCVALFAAAAWVTIFRKSYHAKRQAIESQTQSQSPKRTGSTKIAEPIRVLLQKRVPIRDSTNPRSWLGGLPRLPEDVVWPRRRIASDETPENAPLHFMAQINCADLPDDLWAGLGPREGWLVFFMDARDPGVEDIEEQGGVRVLHVPSIGPKRQPPDDILPVWSGNYSSAYFDNKQPVPSVFPEFPVDITVVSNTGPRTELDIPHAMGGYRDDVQDEEQDDTTSNPLLMQLYGDDDLLWSWGSAGIWFFMVPVDDLAESNFENITAWHQCQ